MSACYINEKMDERSCCDGGFMGTTHALSAVAAFLGVVAFLPEHVFSAFGTSNIWVLVLAIAVTAGASLIPDLDNTNSTSKSSLGVLGDALSVFFRTTSAIIQTTIRLKRDDSTPNPHRGFYHTIPACLILGGMVFWGTTNQTPITFPGIGAITLGVVFAMVITWLNIHMAMAGLAKASVRKLKKKAGIFGELAAFVVSFSLTYLIFYQLPTDLNFWWLGVSVAFGCFIHILGDCFTTSGNPILFPFPIKGKLWYTLRFLPIKAGGVVENVIFVPVFGIICIISFIKISGLFG